MNTTNSSKYARKNITIPNLLLRDTNVRTAACTHYELIYINKHIHSTRHVNNANVLHSLTNHVTAIIIAAYNTPIDCLPKF